MTVLLYDAGGRPAVMDVPKEAPLLLLEAFGTVIGHPSAMKPQDLVRAIVNVVGVEAVKERWPEVRIRGAE